jgi:hypothetical protein
MSSPSRSAVNPHRQGFAANKEPQNMAKHKYCSSPFLQGHGSNGKATEGGGEISLEEAALQLTRLGFTERDSNMALSSAQPAADTVMLSSLLDWLCIHLPEEHLPASFAPGASPRPPPPPKEKEDPPLYWRR